MPLGTEQVPAQLPAPAPSAKRVSFSGCLPEPDPATNASRPMSALQLSRKLLCPAQHDGPILGTNPEAAQHAACSTRKTLLGGKSSRKLLATGANQAQRPVLEQAQQTKSDCRGMLAGRSSRKLLQVAFQVWNEEGPTAENPTDSSKNPANLSTPQNSNRALLVGRSSRRLLSAATAGTSSKAAPPGVAAMSAAAGSSSRGMLAGRSSRKLLSAAAGAAADADSEAAAEAVPTSSQVTSRRGMLGGKSSRKLLSAATAADADSQAAAEVPTSSQATSRRGMLGGKSSRKLLSAATAADLDNKAADSAVSTSNPVAGFRDLLAHRPSRKLLTAAAAAAAAADQVEQQPPKFKQIQFAGNSAGFRARLATRSSRRLLLSSIKEDPGTPTPGTSEANTPLGPGAIKPDTLRSMLGGKPCQAESQKLLLKVAAESLQDEDATSSMNSVQSSSIIPSSGQVHDASAATGSRGAKQGETLLKKLLGMTHLLSRPQVEAADSGSPAAAVVSSSITTTTTTTTSSDTSAGKARAMFAGRSSRKLLCRAGTDSEAANIAGSNLTATCIISSDNSSSATARSAADMLRGRSSRKLMYSTVNGPNLAPGPAAYTEMDSAAAEANVTVQQGCSSRRAMLAGQSSKKLLAQLAVSNTELRPDSVNASTAAAAPGNILGGAPALVIESSSSKEALLADSSSCLLLHTAVLPQVAPPWSPAEVDDSSVDHQAVDAAVDSPGVERSVSYSVVDSKLASDSAESSGPRPRAGAALCQSMESYVDGLALLLRNTTDKTVLLSATAELQDLAACDPSNKLLIGQNRTVIQSLADLLDDSDVDVQCAAAALVHGLASGVPDNQATLGRCCSILKGLIALLGRVSRTARTHAAVALWVLAADNEDIQGEIGATGGASLVENLTRMMSDSAAGCYAVGLIWTLVSDQKGNQALFAGIGHSLQRAGGVISSLLMLMEVGSREEKEYAAGALQGLISGHAHVVRLAQKLGVRERVQVLLREEKEALR